MSPGRAFRAGAVAGAVMSVFMAFARASGVPIELELLLGTLAHPSPGAAAWALGLALHLGLSGLAGILYTLGFEHVTERGGFRVGMLLSVLHVGLVGLLLGLVPRVHPLVPGVLRAPGLFVQNLGETAPLALVIVHVIFGAVIGALYQRDVPGEPDELGPLGPQDLES